MDSTMNADLLNAGTVQNTTRLWTDVASRLAHLAQYITTALRNTSWNTIPLIIGWATISVMGPVVAVRVAYQMFTSFVAQFFSSNALRGKKVLITGASSGLGEALAHALYKRGARLILASRNTHKLNTLKHTLLKTYRVTELHVPTVLELDLEDLNSIPEVIAKLLQSIGHIDIVINNAGISYRGAALDTDVSVDIKLMVVNYFGQVALTKAIVPSMMKRRSGHVVAVSSVQGKLAIPYRSCYTASKHALQAFFDTLRAEVADSGIKVSVVSPGYIATQLSRNALTHDGSSYGVMDKTTSEGMKPDVVAEHIVQCLLKGQEEMVIASPLHQIALILRSLTPSLISQVMKARAVKQKGEIKRYRKLE